MPSQVLLGIVLIGLIAWLAESLVFRRIERHYQAWRNRFRTIQSS
jgi:ABC-type nitrate/sulfonate/bicarbonate transport system permease component